MIKVENGTVESYGNGLDLIAEGCTAMITAITRVSHKDSAVAETLYYSSITAVAESLASKGLNIDLDRVALNIIKKGENDGPNNGSMD